MRTRRSIVPHRSALFVLATLACCLPMGGCNPNLDVDGALVPAWITAGAVGILATLGARTLLVRTGVDRHLIARPGVYLSLAVTFTCLIWIVVFRY